MSSTTLPDAGGGRSTLSGTSVTASRVLGES